MDKIDKDLSIISLIDEDDLQLQPCIYRIANDCYSCT